MVQKNSVNKPKIIVIVGATASGKTSTSVRLAKEFNGEIISADSMQIYKGMDVGTAKVTPSEMLGIKHHLIDIVEPTESYSVAMWVRDAKEKITEIISRGKNPIIVGGTGLYVTSLLNGYSFFDTPQDDERRNYYKSVLQEKGIDYLHNLLKEKSPAKAEEIDKHKTKAVIRALEIIDHGGIEEKTEPPYKYLLIGLNHPRDVLYDRINLRVDEMFTHGLMQEFETLRKIYGLTSSHQSAGAIGYKELFLYENKEIDLETTKDLIKQHSRNYAKRQLTWFRRMPNIVWLSPTSEYEKIKGLVKEFIGE